MPTTVAKSPERYSTVHYRTPREVWCKIFGYLSRRDKARGVLICWHTHDIAAYSLYRHLVIEGKRGRVLVAMLASRRTIPVFYASLVRRVHVLGFEQCDRYVTFPVLCRALKLMHGVISIAMGIASTSTSHFVQCLKREGLIRHPYLGPASNGAEANHLPKLQRISLNTSVELVTLASSRKVIDIELLEPLSHLTLRVLLDYIRVQPGPLLQELRLELARKDAEASIFIQTICDAVPNLHVLILGNSGDPSPLVRHISSSTDCLPRNLVALGCNTQLSGHNSFWHTANRDILYTTHVEDFAKIREQYPNLRFIGFGYTGYMAHSRYSSFQEALGEDAMEWLAINRRR